MFELFKKKLTLENLFVSLAFLNIYKLSIAQLWICILFYFYSQLVYTSIHYFIYIRRVKMCDARLHGDRPACDVGRVQDCTVFLSFPVTLAIAEVPTKKFSFYCTRPVETRPPPTNVMVSWWRDQLLPTLILAGLVNFERWRERTSSKTTSATTWRNKESVFLPTLYQVWATTSSPTSLLSSSRWIRKYGTPSTTRTIGAG